MKTQTRIKILMVIIALFGRLIPHPFNMTPTAAFAARSGQLFKRRHALLISLGSFFLADITLALWQHHAVFGSWSVFTYSALAMMTFCAHTTAQWSRSSQWLFVIGGSLGFWLWTNFGCWLSMPEYPLSLAGLLSCYARALPFLSSQLLGDSLWLIGILAATAQIKQRQTA